MQLDLQVQVLLVELVELVNQIQLQEQLQHTLVVVAVADKDQQVLVELVVAEQVVPALVQQLEQLILAVVAAVNLAEDVVLSVMVVVQEL
tara:strand:- start:770 stop:1039 length:270 start_codon:yes stop_codon:yes gene_type:complete